MTTLVEMMTAPQRRDAIIADCVRMAELHVAKVRGVGGLGLRAGLRALRAVRPDAMTRAVTVLLPQFAEALDPFYRQFRASGEKNFAAYLEPRRKEARDALLAVTDARAAAGTNRALIATYRKLRGVLGSELEAILPDLVRVIGVRVEFPGRTD